MTRSETKLFPDMLFGDEDGVDEVECMGGWSTPGSSILGPFLAGI